MQHNEARLPCCALGYASPSSRRSCEELMRSVITGHRSQRRKPETGL